MTKTEDRSKIVAIKELLERDEDFVRSAVQGFVQAALEAEMTEALHPCGAHLPEYGELLAAGAGAGG